MSNNQGHAMAYGETPMEYGGYQMNAAPVSTMDVSFKPDSDGDDDLDGTEKDVKRAGRRKIKIEYIQDKSRRHITFSKRKAGIMKKAYELSTLTGTQVLLLVVSETGLVYTFTTPKLQPLVTKTEGKNLIQSCLNTPDEPQKEGSAAPEGEQDDGGFSSGGDASSVPLMTNGSRENDPMKRPMEHLQDEGPKHDTSTFSPNQPQLSYGGGEIQPSYNNPPPSYQQMPPGAYPPSNPGSMPPVPQQQYQPHPQNPYMGPPQTHHQQPHHQQVAPHHPQMAPHHQQPPHHQPLNHHQSHHHQPPQQPQQPQHHVSGPQSYPDYHNVPHYQQQHPPPPPPGQYSYNPGNFHHPGPAPHQ